MICKPGMLATIPFPYADMAVSKKRPVLVLTVPDRHGDFIGLAITSVPTEENALLIDSSKPQPTRDTCFLASSPRKRGSKESTHLSLTFWIPAFAGMTIILLCHISSSEFVASGFPLLRE